MSNSEIINIFGKTTRVRIIDYLSRNGDWCNIEHISRNSCASTHVIYPIIIKLYRNKIIERKVSKVGRQTYLYHINKDKIKEVIKELRSKENKPFRKSLEGKDK